MAFPAVFNPPVPFHMPLGQTKSNDMLYIHGVPTTAQRFAVNLETDNGDIAFHFNPRINEGQVVRNSKIGGGWGGEERHGGFPFHQGQPFEIIILIHDAHYKVAVNGAHFIEFTHRVPKEAVRRLAINGDVQLQSVRYQSANPYGSVPVPSGPSYPIFSPPLPYNSAIPGGMHPGRMIRITGVPTGNSFAIDLQSGSTIAFHFNVRFNQGSDHHVVVRNSCINGGWGGEERHAPGFPFSHHTPFDIIILADGSSFKVAVNNQHFIEFGHRVPLASVNQMHIRGDLQVQMIQYQ